MSLLHSLSSSLSLCPLPSLILPLSLSSPSLSSPLPPSPSSLSLSPLSLPHPPPSLSLLFPSPPSSLPLSPSLSSPPLLPPSLLPSLSTPSQLLLVLASYLSSLEAERHKLKAQVKRLCQENNWLRQELVQTQQLLQTAEIQLAEIKEDREHSSFLLTVNKVVVMATQR